MSLLLRNNSSNSPSRTTKELNLKNSPGIDNCAIKFADFLLREKLFRGTFGFASLLMWIPLNPIYGSEPQITETN
jgi:hypothetical protein